VPKRFGIAGSDEGEAVTTLVLHDPPGDIRRHLAMIPDDAAAQPRIAGAVNEGDQHRVIATIVSAFIADPVERWLWPEARQYLTHFPAFVAAFGAAAFRSGTVSTLEDFAAVAMWIPPGTEPDGEQIVAVLDSTLAPDRKDDAFAVLEQMERTHPKDAHWYLPWLAVDPARQRAGLGAELLERGLARSDAARLPAFLETPNPRTVRFYERHGFGIVGIARAGACPPITSMLRAAR
jgi:ribosomal protein S18 acetylase RimI-like enzyme